MCPKLVGYSLVSDTFWEKVTQWVSDLRLNFQKLFFHLPRGDIGVEQNNRITGVEKNDKMALNRHLTRYYTKFID